MAQNISALMPAGVEAFLYEQIGSTMDEGRRLLQAGQACPFWVLSRAQTAGRGRRGRVWSGLSGNFFGSFLWRPEPNQRDMSALPFVASLAVHRALITVGVRPDQLKCKWPNDVLLEGAKVSGILIETTAGTGGVIEWVSIGIGVNLAAAPVDTPYPATSVYDATGEVPSFEAFAEALAASLSEQLSDWLNVGFQSVKKAWLEVAFGLGDPVTVNLADEQVPGRFIGLADDGGFILGLNDGRERLIYAGDVFPGSVTAAENLENDAC